MNNMDYPEGADNERAPWNQEQQPDRELDVTISLGISKTFKVMVNDYDVIRESDEDGFICSYDYSNCDIFKAVDEQVDLSNFEEEGWEIDYQEVATDK